jgi:hypothetical protein
MLLLSNKTGDRAITLQTNPYVPQNVCNTRSLGCGGLA